MDFYLVNTRYQVQSQEVPGFFFVQSENNCVAPLHPGHQESISPLITHVQQFIQCLPLTNVGYSCSEVIKLYFVICKLKITTRGWQENRHSQTIILKKLQAHECQKIKESVAHSCFWVLSQSSVLLLDFPLLVAYIYI